MPDEEETHEIRLVPCSSIVIEICVFLKFVIPLQCGSYLSKVCRDPVTRRELQVSDRASRWLSRGILYCRRGCTAHIETSGQQAILTGHPRNFVVHEILPAYHKVLVTAVFRCFFVCIGRLPQWILSRRTNENLG